MSCLHRIARKGVCIGMKLKTTSSLNVDEPISEDYAEEDSPELKQ